MTFLWTSCVKGLKHFEKLHLTILRILRLSDTGASRSGKELFLQSASLVRYEIDFYSTSILMSRPLISYLQTLPLHQDWIRDIFYYLFFEVKNSVFCSFWTNLTWYFSFFTVDFELFLQAVNLFLGDYFRKTFRHRCLEARVWYHFDSFFIVDHRSTKERNRRSQWSKTIKTTCESEKWNKSSAGETG